MGKCFFIQPFDRGKVDKRYEDVFVPAIRAAGLEPYRVDRDPNVSIPIDEIQAGIESSEACLVDITTDNPNVWFELGYAIASQREIALICEDKRPTKFPFDVQHRSIIQSSSESPSDFNKLQDDITARLKAIMERRAKLGQVSRLQSASKVEGLEPHEIATLVSIAEDFSDPDGISDYRIRNSMESAGFTKIATALGVKSLLDRGMITSEVVDPHNADPYTAYRITNKGMTWLFQNKNMLNLTEEPPPPDSDIPF